MIFFLPTAVLIVIAWFVKYKKVTELISGYNTASKEEKLRYYIDKLTTKVVNFFFILASIFFVMAMASIVFDQHVDQITLIGFVVLAITLVTGIIYLNTGNRVLK